MSLMWRGKSLFLVNFILVTSTLLLLSKVSQVFSAPYSKRRHQQGISDGSHYLLNFGYLPQSGIEIRDQVSEERMEQALRNLQAFGNINITGKLDEATVNLMKKPRCGVPDVLVGQFGSRYKRFIIQGQRWPNTSLTWSLKSSTNSQPEQLIINELGRAFDVWSQNTPLEFHRLEKERADEADIRIVFQRRYHDDGYPFDGKGSILAHAFFPGSGQGGDAHFDDDEVWLVDGQDPNGEGTRLFAVAAHEFGHSLGLSHSNVQGALMYPWYQDFNYTLVLHQDDALGIRQIYGSNGQSYVPPRRPPNVPPRRPERPQLPSPPDGGRPNTCDSSYDAISLIRQELFIFRGPYFWRINTNDNQLLKGYPSLIVNMWMALPNNLTHVDAVYEHKEVEIIFFIGKEYWRFQGNVPLPGYPKSLESMGISKDVERIDGAMTWGHNGRTYLFSNSQYWRLTEDEREFRVEPDYPRDMYVWRGVPYNIDSVFRWKDGSVYFFKGKVFWKFDDRLMRVVSETPSLSAPFWMGCSAPPLDPEEKEDRGEEEEEGEFTWAILALFLFLGFLIVAAVATMMARQMCPSISSYRQNRFRHPIQNA